MLYLHVSPISIFDPITFGPLLDSVEYSLHEATTCLQWFEDTCESCEDQSRFRFLPAGVDETSKALPPLSEITDEVIEKWFEGKNREDILRDRQREMDSIFEKTPLRASLIHARSFLYCLDRISQLIRVLAREGPFVEVFSIAREEFDLSFPGLREHRNSSAHIEDRLRGLGSRERPIPFNPLFVSESLANRVYQNTIADGSIGMIEVSIETLLKVQSIVETAFQETEILIQEQQRLAHSRNIIEYDSQNSIRSET